MGSFQVIVVVIFVVLAVFGILVFSCAIPLGGDDEPGSLGTVILWGTVRAEAITSLIQDFNAANQAFVLKYEQKSAESFDQDLLEALAEGRGPDMILLPDNLAFHYANKIFTIPYQSFSLAAFKNTFAGAGEVFLTSKGVLAFPLSIDPLVMYYNRAILDASGIIRPPAFWDELLTLVPVLTKKDEANKIMRSTVALGHFSNVAHAKDIISALFMQAGNSIVSESEGRFSSSLNAPNPGYNISTVLRFYTDFADPNKDVYSWNKSFPNSGEAFSREDLAFYFAPASELRLLVNRNPNQNFLVAPLPQIRGASYKLTGAQVLGIAILSSSKNYNTAFTAANLLATGDFAAKFAGATGVAPARRDLLFQKPPDAFFPTFYNSALYSKSWIDPSPQDTDDIFRRMVDAVLSNNMTVEDAIRDASGKLGILLLR